MVVVPLVAACQREPDPTPNETAAVEPKPAPSKIPPIRPVAPLGRAELLAAVAAAADEAAAGNPLPDANLQLTNRTFELRLPFGCADGISGRWGEWRIDPKTHVLKISVRPQLWGDDPTFQSLASDMTYDAAEGFWIERPWTRSEQCPPAPPTTAATTEVPPGEEPPVAPPAPEPVRTFALVQYFSPDAPRTLRRGSRPYSYTAKVPEVQGAAPRKFHLKLTGRISGFADGQPIHCVVTEPIAPPVCAAAVEFTQVVLEDADTGDSLAEWK